MKNFLAIIVATALLFGCNSSPPEPINTIKPIDKATVAAVQMGFKSDPEMASYNITVSAKLDRLILSGTVGSEEAKEKAEKMAKKTPSISHVDNKLTVQSE